MHTGQLNTDLHRQHSLFTPLPGFIIHFLNPFLALFIQDACETKDSISSLHHGEMYRFVYAKCWRDSINVCILYQVLSGCGESTEKKNPTSKQNPCMCLLVFLPHYLYFSFTQLSLSEQSLSRLLLISAFHSLSLDSPSFLPPSPCPPAAKLQLCLGKADCGIPGKPLRVEKRGGGDDLTQHIYSAVDILAFVVKRKRLTLRKVDFSLSQ